MQQNQNALMRHGLSLSKPVLRRLSAVGIVAQPQISLEFQQGAKRYVVRGIESGGAVQDIGRYVTFCGAEGEPLEYVHTVDSLALNGSHAVVVAPALTRVELFRTGRTCQLLISQHRAGDLQNGRRPSVESSTIFRGVDGVLNAEALKQSPAELRGLLRFWTRSGEELPIPALFEDSIKAAAIGCTCTGCSHPHFLRQRLELSGAADMT